MTELLTGALLADGTGHPLRPADVIIDNGRITAVEPPGTLPEHHPRRDLTGLVLAPGFIDVHSHADNAPLLTEDDTTKILQGVTTEVVGNCGFSLAPRSTTHAEVHDGFLQRLFPPLDVTWNRSPNSSTPPTPQVTSPTTARSSVTAPSASPPPA